MCYDNQFFYLLFSVPLPPREFFLSCHGCPQDFNVWVRLRVLHGKPVCISVPEITRAGHRDSAKRKTSSFPRPVLASGVSLSAGTRGGCGSQIDYGRRSLSDGLACTGLSREVLYCISLGRIMIRSKCRDRDSSGRNTSPLGGSPAANPPACDASAPLNSLCSVHPLQLRSGVTISAVLGELSYTPLGYADVVLAPSSHQDPTPRGQPAQTLCCRIGRNLFPVRSSLDI